MKQTEMMECSSELSCSRASPRRLRRAEVERLVARVTGESRRTVSRYGFSVLEEAPLPDPELVAVGCECGGCGRVVQLKPRQYGALRPEAVCYGCDAAYLVRLDELFAIDDAEGFEATEVVATDL